MDVKRRRIQDLAEKDDSTAADTGNSGVAKPVELNAEVGKPHFLSGESELPHSSATIPKVVEKGKGTQYDFPEQWLRPQQRSQQREQDSCNRSLYKKVKELNKKKDIVCLIISSYEFGEQRETQELGSRCFEDKLQIEGKEQEK